jgi:hypothetical protein
MFAYDSGGRMSFCQQTSRLKTFRQPLLHDEYWKCECWVQLLLMFVFVMMMLEGFKVKKIIRNFNSIFYISLGVLFLTVILLNFHMLSVILISVILLGVVLLNVVLLSVILPGVDMLSVSKLTVIMLSIV